MLTTFIVVGVFVSGCARSVREETVMPTKMVTASRDKLLRKHDETNRRYKKAENKTE